MKKPDINSMEIARLAGVSRSTVSRVINQYPNVPQATRDKVMRVIEKYQYVPNLSAQIMAGKDTHTIGLFMISPGPVSGDCISNMLITRIIESASQLGYYVLTHIIRNTREMEEQRLVRDAFYQKRIDGGIFIGAANYEPLIEELIAQGYKVGIVDQLLPGQDEASRIVANFDNCTGMAQGLDYLVGLGHRDIGFISGDPMRLSGKERYDGFVHGMISRGLAVREEWIIPAGSFCENDGYQATSAWLETVEKLPTAIFAINDSMAFGALRALLEKGLRVPEDVSLLGFDDHILSSRIQPALSTLQVDFSSMMARLTESLIASLTDRPDQPLPENAGTTLMIRASCRALEQPE